MPVLLRVSGRAGVGAAVVGPAIAGADVGPVVAGAGAEITGAGVGARPRWERVWPLLPPTITVTRTMTTMATAVMDTDRTDLRRRLELDLERTGHGRVHGVPGGGGDVKEAAQPKTEA
jgi:hypothetical protein